MKTTRPGTVAAAALVASATTAGAAGPARSDSAGSGRSGSAGSGHSDTAGSARFGSAGLARFGSAEPVLGVDGLSVRFRLRDATVHAVSDLALTVHPGELLAVVGESGCGKSVLAHALLGLLPRNATVGGHARLHGPGGSQLDLVTCGERVLAGSVRGRRVGLVPQSPATALNPVRTGRRLIEETLRAHRHTRAEAAAGADPVAAQVGLDATDLDRFPHELSGGMAQRLVTALALAPDPTLLIADEPTSGLDRPLVEQTLDLLRRRCDSGKSVILITHDLAAAERVADTVAVMYASRVVEHRSAERFFTAPAHPYAAALLDALPDRAFRAVPGYPPMLTALPEGCAFAARCPYATDACRRQPPLAAYDAGAVACHHPLPAGVPS